MEADIFIIAIILPDMSLSFIRHLTAPHYISRDDESFWVNCSANQNPSNNAAEFIIGDGGTRLSGTRGGCYSSLIRKHCSVDECQCSQESTSFLLNIKPSGSQTITVTCSMQFASAVSKSLSVHVLDISRPTISVTEEQPLLVGSNPRVRCRVSTTLDVTLELGCFNTTSTSVLRNPMTVETDISVVIKTLQENNCSCSVTYMNFTRTVFREILTTDRPNLILGSNAVCNATKSITLLCEIRVPPSLHAFGFGVWTFKFDGVNVKHFNGTSNGTLSSLTIDNCSYLHMGTYMCSGFVELNETRYSANKTTELAINSGPVIVNTEMFIKDLYTVLSVKYFSESNAVSEWYENDNLISNALNLYFDTRNTSFPVKVFEVVLNRYGYDSQLAIKSENLRNGGQFHVVLQNAHGFVRRNFTISEVVTFPHLWTWFLVSVACLVTIMTGVVGLVLIVKNRGHGSVGRYGRDSSRIYFAAPEDEMYRRVYNTTAEMIDNYIDPVTDEDSNRYEEIPDLPETYEEPIAIRRNSEEANMADAQRTYDEPSSVPTNTGEVNMIGTQRTYEEPSAVQTNNEEANMTDGRRTYEEPSAVQTNTGEANMTYRHRTYEEPSSVQTNTGEVNMTGRRRTYEEPSVVQTNTGEANMTYRHRTYEEPSSVQTNTGEVNMTGRRRTYEEPSAVQTNTGEANMTYRHQTYEDASAVQTNNEEANMNDQHRTYKKSNAIQTHVKEVDIAGQKRTYEELMAIQTNAEEYDMCMAVPQGTYEDASAVPINTAEANMVHPTRTYEDQIGVQTNTEEAISADRQKHMRNQAYTGEVNIADTERTYEEQSTVQTNTEEANMADPQGK